MLRIIFFIQEFQTRYTEMTYCISYKQAKSLSTVHTMWKTEFGQLVPFKAVVEFYHDKHTHSNYLHILQGLF